MMVDLSKDNLKAMASRLRTYLRDDGIELKHTNALEAVAQMLGHRNWNTLAASSERSDPTSAEPVRTDLYYWPWVARAIKGERRPNGAPRHLLQTWQAPKRDGTNTLSFDFVTMKPEPSPIGVPITGGAGDDEVVALLGVFTAAIAKIIDEYADGGLAVASQWSHETSGNMRSATLTFHIPSIEKVELTLRAEGGANYEEGKANLVAEAREVAVYLHARAASMLAAWRASGRPFIQLAKHGQWVEYALYAARLTGSEHKLAS
jgi:hypothetical protein